ncbi:MULTISPECIES: hypothetical protein [unclassified Nostoc]
MIIRNTKNTIFTPTVGARTGLVMGEIVPSSTVRTVVFAHPFPLAIA